jgi:hypothetical protein
VLKILEDGVADFLRQWESRFAAALAFHNKTAVIPVDVGKTQAGYIAWRCLYMRGGGLSWLPVSSAAGSFIISEFTSL